MKPHGDHLLAAMPVPKAFFKLAVPAVAAQLINILYNLVDKMFIGHIPEVGKQALAGVGVTTPVILAISAFAALVSMGGAPKASIFLGKGENEQAERVIGSCTWMLLLLSALLTGVMLAFGQPILLLFGASADTISFAADYMNIYCLGTVFTQLTLGLNAFITAQGKTLVSMGNVAVGADEHRAGCRVYQRLRYGRQGSCAGNRYRARHIHLFCHSLSLHGQERSAASTAEYPF